MCKASQRYKLQYQYAVHFVEQTTICKSTIMKSLAKFMQGKYKVINPVY